MGSLAKFRPLDLDSLKQSIMVVSCSSHNYLSSCIFFSFFLYEQNKHYHLICIKVPININSWPDWRVSYNFQIIFELTVKYEKWGKYLSYCTKLPCGNYFINNPKTYLAWYSNSKVKYHKTWMWWKCYFRNHMLQLGYPMLFIFTVKKFETNSAVWKMKKLMQSR